MSDINTDLSNLLADFAKNSLVSPSQHVADAIAADSDGSIAAPAVSEPVIVPPTVVAPPTIEPTPAVVEPVIEAPVAVDDSSVFSDWDSTPKAVDTPTGVQVPAVDNTIILELGKVLGKDFKDVPSVVNELTALKAELEKSKSSGNIRAELAKAIELDQKGGDFYEYLKVSQNDWSKEDPIELYENYLIDSLAEKDGQVDVDKVNEYLDSIPEPEKKVRGKELQRQLIAEQARKIADIETAAIHKKERADSELKAALTGLSEIDGFRVDDKHRKEVFDWVVSGKIMKDLFYDGKGELDPAKVAKIAFRNLYFEKLDSYQKSKIRNVTKRDVLADITNQQITAPNSTSAAAPTKKAFGVDDYISLLETNFNTRK